MTFFSEVWHHMDHAKNICNVNEKQAGPQTHEIVEIVSNAYARYCLPILTPHTWKVYSTCSGVLPSV